MITLKSALGLVVILLMAACVPAGIPPTGPGVYGAPVTSRVARVPGTLSEIDIVRAVQSSL